MCYFPSFKFKFSDFRFAIFTGELYDKSPAFEPLLGAAHQLQDFARLFVVEVRVGKGLLFTPPPFGRVRSASERVSR